MARHLCIALMVLAAAAFVSGIPLSGPGSLPPGLRARSPAAVGAFVHLKGEPLGARQRARGFSPTCKPSLGRSCMLGRPVEGASGRLGGRDSDRSRGVGRGMLGRLAAKQGSADADADGDGAANFFFSPQSDEYPMDYFGESTRNDLLPHKDFIESNEVLTPEEASQVCEDLGLDRWGTPKTWGLPAEPQRAVFCSRTLNLRAIRCIGYDMDYTLIHYKVTEWEGRAYHYAKQNLKQVGFPIDELEFNPELVCRGTIIDKKLGNIVKVDRFGYVKRAMHGTKRLSHRETHEIYGRLLMDLRDSKRWLFLNTLFSVSEGCLYAQLVEKLDAGSLQVTDSSTGKMMDLNYEQTFNAVSKALFKAHVEGRLKADVMMNPEMYVEFDAELPKTLLDQRESGKKLALITNSDWEYTKVMMHHVFDRFLPGGMTWRDLFDVIIVSARKPAFFSQNMPLYEIVTEDGMMREKFKMKEGRIYSGGSASMVEQLFGVDSDDVMYVGDHIFSDVNVAKAGREHTEELRQLIKKKEQCSNILNHMRTELHRFRKTSESSLFNKENETSLYELMGKLLATMIDYDNRIAPMLYQDGSHFNEYWGYISRAGFNDQSHLMRQIEKYADVYTSRVANFLRYTPYMYFRNARIVLAHHRNLELYRDAVPDNVLGDLNDYKLKREESLGDEMDSDWTAGLTPELSEFESELRGWAEKYKPETVDQREVSVDTTSAQEDPGLRNIRNEQAAWMQGPSDEFGHVIDNSGISELDDVKDIKKR